MNVVVDVDDVLRDFNGALLKKYNEVYKDDVKLEDITNWQTIEHLPKIKNLQGFVNKYREDLLLSAGALPTSIGSMYELKELGYGLTIASNQFKGLEGYTLAWLYKNDVRYDNLFFGKDKGLVRGDFFLDDKAGNLEKFKHGNPDSKVFLMDKPWNRGYDYPRIHVFRDFLYEVIKK